MNIEDLKHRGFVTLKYPSELRGRVQEAMASWRRFCDLPDAQKALLAGGDRLNDFGYMRRRDTGATADNKELFHATKREMPVLADRARAIADERAVQFIHAVDQLITSIEPAVASFAALVEHRYGLAGFEQAVKTSVDRWVFRYLHYFPGETLANAHADRGGFTLHLFESAPGGEYLDLHKRWQPWPVSEEETIIFPGMVLQHRSRGDLKALWHRVVSTEATKASGRFSMVVFVDLRHTHRYNDGAKRLQDFEAGFNYDLPFSELEKLFMPGSVNEEFRPARL
ncbi:hypothetical protein HY634_02830 [Candidatus Uhrbacteria bacterium]|nr:hypothetical protein [Candidatus Uhrbacteria bacterium]